MGRRLAILDRDGTIIAERNYLSDPDGVELFACTGAALKKLQGLGLRLIVITNQSGVARRFFDMETVDAIHQRMIELLEKQGVLLEGVFVCPHKPDEGCDCRKPQPGLARLAAERLDADLGASFVIGDKACDVDLARNIGATSILVRTGHGEREAVSGKCQPNFVAADLLEAAKFIEMQMQ